ncbi:unnamed protein product, partial [Acidithrix sp. C25]
VLYLLIGTWHLIKADHTLALSGVKNHLVFPNKLDTKMISATNPPWWRVIW